MNIQLKEAYIGARKRELDFDTHLNTTEGFMRGASFFLPVRDALPLMELARQRTICGWTVTRMPELLFKATKTIKDEWGSEYSVTFRYYYCTGEYTVTFDDDIPGKREFEYDNSLQAKQKIRNWLNGR